MKTLSSPLVATLLVFPYLPSSASPLDDCRDTCDSEHKFLRRGCRNGCRRAEMIVDLTWSVVRYRSRKGEIVSVLPDSHPSLTLTSGGLVGAYSGCNRLNAPYGGLTGETFEVYPGAMKTRMWCPDLGVQEADLFGLLALGTVGWAVAGSDDGTELTLSDPETGEETMVLLSLDDGDEDGGGDDDRAADDVPSRGGDRRDARDGDGTGGGGMHRKKSPENDAVPPADGAPLGPEKRSMGGAGERSAWEEGRHKKHSGENRPPPPPPRPLSFDDGEGQARSDLGVRDGLLWTSRVAAESMMA